MREDRITRRSLLKIAGAAAAVPHVITSAALGDATRAPASDRVTIGHIGVGTRGRGLFGPFRALRDAQIVAVADCYEDRRDSMAKVCKGKAYRDFREMLARDDIDAVVIATPDHQHVPIAIMAARAGKSAYVEKPLGLSIEQDFACQKTFAEENKVFQYGTQQRSMPHCRQACELVRRGAIGTIRKIEVDCPNGGQGGSTTEAPVPKTLDYDMWLGPAPVAPYTVDRCTRPGTYWIYDQSIGYLAGWGAHPLDLMVWACEAHLSGPIVVEGTGVIPTEGLYNTVYNWDVKIQLGDVELIFRPGTDRTKFVGTDGWIQVARNPRDTLASDPAILETALDPTEDQLPTSTNHQGNFVQAVKHNDPKLTVSNLVDAVRSDVISHLSDIAVRTGEKIAWDPAERNLTAGSEKARAMLSRPMRAPWTL